MYYVNKPQKPKFSKGMANYLLIMSSFLLFFLIFIANVDWSIRLENGIKLFLMLDGIPLGIYLFFYIKKWSDYNLAQENFAEYERRKIEEHKALVRAQEQKQAQLDREYEEAVESQKSTTPWTVRYSTSPCPYCGHYKVRYAKWEDKRLSVAFWGAASSKIGTNYKCEHCGTMWE